MGPIAKVRWLYVLAGVFYALVGALWLFERHYLVGALWCAAALLWVAGAFLWLRVRKAKAQTPQD